MNIGLQHCENVLLWHLNWQQVCALVPFQMSKSETWRGVSIPNVHKFPFGDVPPKKPDVERIVFVFAFAKSDRATITKKEEEPLRMTAEIFFSASDEKINDLLEIGEATEVIENE